MKVGKEEILGVLAAMEWSSKRDYRADCRIWESRLQHIAKVVNAIPGVQAEIYYRKVGQFWLRPKVGEVLTGYL